MLYKVNVRKGLGPGNWADFSKVIFEISLDNMRYRGPSLFSILEWGKNRFSSIEIIVCDTLQRHNLMFQHNIDEKQSIILSRSMGDQWISDAQNYFDTLSIKPNITRWEDWINHDPKRYKSEYNSLLSLYVLNSDFQKEIDEIFSEIWLRRSQQNNYPNEIKQYFKDNVLLPYFFEETALSSIFLPIINGVSAYPGSLPKFWSYFIEGKVNFLQGFKNQLFINLNLTRSCHRQLIAVDTEVFLY